MHFAVRGRWPDPTALTYWIDARRSPVAEDAMRAEIARACATWKATGLAAFAPARDRESASVVLSWHRGHHGACEPFGISDSVAHSGPVRPGTFVHFDAGREWSTSGDGEAYSVYATALHELGHVLGLGHSLAKDAVMRTGTIEEAPLAPSDLLGLQSLYGGGDDRPGDLEVRGPDGVRTTLRCVAPPDVSGFDVFDADGDGRDEIVVWRHDKAGLGVVTSYRFDDECRLVRSVGPLFGMASTGAEHVVAKLASGQRVFVVVFGNGKRVARLFDEHGLLGPGKGVDPEAPEIGAAIAAARRERDRAHGDLSGDGVVETVRRLR